MHQLPRTGTAELSLLAWLQKARARAANPTFGCVSFCKTKRVRVLRARQTARQMPAYMERPAFCGITTKPVEGVVDTAAEGGLIGSVPLDALQSELHARGLQLQWTPKRSQAKGVGGNANVLGVAMIPIGLGGINGVLETTVVEGDVPFLLPIRMLRALESLIDLKRCTLTLQAHGHMEELLI